MSPAVVAGTFNDSSQPTIIVFLTMIIFSLCASHLFNLRGLWSKSSKGSHTCLSLVICLIWLSYDHSSTIQAVSLQIHQLAVSLFIIFERGNLKHMSFAKFTCKVDHSEVKFVWLRVLHIFFATDPSCSQTEPQVPCISVQHGTQWVSL